VIWLCGYDGEYIDSWIAENPGARRSGDLNIEEADEGEEGEQLGIYGEELQ
jgi:hypothetical protein